MKYLFLKERFISIIKFTFTIAKIKAFRKLDKNESGES